MDSNPVNFSATRHDAYVIFFLGTVRLEFLIFPGNCQLLSHKAVTGQLVTSGIPARNVLKEGGMISKSQKAACTRHPHPISGQQDQCQPNVGKGIMAGMPLCNPSEAYTVL